MGVVNDPGWSPAVPIAAIGIVPFFGEQHLNAARPRLVGARARVLASVVQQWLSLGVLLTLGEPEEQNGLLPWILVGASTISALFAAPYFQRTVIGRMTAEVDLADVFSRVQRMMVAFSMAPAVVGFAGFFLGGGMVVYAAGMAASHIALFLSRPSSPLLDRIQQRIDVLGRGVDIRAAVLSA